MTVSQCVDTEALGAAFADAKKRYAEFTNLGLNVTRGKPSSAQLDLAEGMLTALSAGDHIGSEDGDLRNYGGQRKGLRELREIFAPLVQVPTEQLVARDNSSLSLMHFAMASSFFHPLPGSDTAWAGQRVRFLAPSPGYDRHFAVSAELGVDLITVGMNDDGPDMDAVEKLVATDATIKGIWCVPKYSNPTGITYSDEVVRRLASMKVAADDFRIYWDNAYAIHHLSENHDEVLSILDACEQAGNPDRAFVFASTSKVSFAGGGVSFFGASKDNITWFLARDAMRSIGPDKINQLRHVRFFEDSQGVIAHMRKHAEILAPKFEAVGAALNRDLKSLKVAQWTEPVGGYFVSVDVVPGTAKRVVELAQQVGVALTPAGATYPGGQDPTDSNLRLAPSYPDLEELTQAMEVFTTCVIIAAGEKLLTE
ncbi:aminotransferase class I/II-fold pyridoxal phosphate-dependent enzyme [Dermatophilus congolensis]|uniref:Putative aminotransferase MSMEG_6286 n=1 Tax=Dermatophilus congolensis TaxID=1863 RepID=A0A239VR70_9MICO|nr:aminotransferase class I/II-fold pyridoxal phosphate-dependent enzyme [Dermatophilus congolensis]MBO3129707.1 aminotransferase class I/II-fold pyridoxal phosphate-dependent enzyme [Dermatophilus congolensis]MBO3131663.1 aminotransferase class I/II-fold pyridoxal phosphate-dependent enzyme [Dermatophilus congolensis]MBO3134181.1 aminotransferase class I/II-fold pyridoxal phosphate-dependent enzyme [Dermatophilus congolensis]MBO3136415.1 aminotransferase class I/II-fold pyridoxal phosphate-dep